MHIPANTEIYVQYVCFNNEAKETRSGTLWLHIWINEYNVLFNSKECSEWVQHVTSFTEMMLQKARNLYLVCICVGVFMYVRAWVREWMCVHLQADMFTSVLLSDLACVITSCLYEILHAVTNMHNVHVYSHEHVFI